MIEKAKRIGIALSGGGYRAAGFHLGTLKKLNELGILECVDVLSTISGGSITGAAYSLHSGDFNAFEQKMITSLTTKSVIRYVLTSWIFWRGALPLTLLLLSSFILPFTRLAGYSIIPQLLFLFLMVRYQFKLLPLSRIIEKAYDKFFCMKATLADLKDRPELAIGSTNLQTMRHFTFSKRKMEDSTYAFYTKPVLFNGATFPVARAVMASSCVPFAFTPVQIDKVFYQDEILYGTMNPQLVDGGVYDSQGIHKITQGNSSYACDIVVVSDAGNKLPFAKLYNSTLTLLLRTVDTFMVRIKNFQMIQNVYQNQHGREIAYLSLGWDLGGCISGYYDGLVNKNIPATLSEAHELPAAWLDTPKLYKSDIIQHLEKRCQFAEINAHSLTPERLQTIRRIGTNLTRIKPQLVKDMIIHAANLTELQVRLYCPSLLTATSNS
ncbi:patatin-like phospholipase family protein [Mucilaginibacter daejeonensis]|uniref:patatin-like phospholipase family protein n=1 Tax=Mucilaginibacter daejeonensis TaxID=398049 RepID=UPI001D171232|nr:patatin-like phospholipase family protein [Mucilaginibacter daejeonensis]UEG51853.1 patatin-like phospholipase family protein [Mucilaginibacter daejeonensis]